MKILPLVPHRAPSEIGEVAARKLRESPYFFLKSLTCRFADGVVTLYGTVPYEQLRGFAESIVLRVEGVEEVNNRIEVVDPVRRATDAQSVRNAG
jgi:hypothetical protein